MSFEFPPDLPLCQGRAGDNSKLKTKNSKLVWELSRMAEVKDGTGSETEASKTLRALVIGGGIAGIQAALDLANARIPVTVVEKSPSLGGRMAQLDKTFPTMDCAI